MASGQINVRVAESLRVQGNLALEEARMEPIASHSGNLGIRGTA